MESLHYSIRPASPEAHLFEVVLRIAQPDPSGQCFSLPAWIPGSYMIREFARHLEALEATRGGRPVRVEKIDKASWRCAPASGRAAGQPLVLRYRVYAWDLSVRAAHLDRDHGFFNATSVFVRVAGQESVPLTVDIERPTGAAYRAWRVATTLPRATGSAGAAEYGFGRYRADGYDELADHPVEMGRFEVAGFDVGGCRHEIVVTGRGRYDLERLAKDLRPVCAAQIALFEPVRKRAPVGRYLFLTTAVGDGYGGLEHRASTALLCGRDDLPWPGMDGVPDGYQTFLGLASHEYFHTWHVKRIKPACFDPYDYAREVHTSLLWIFEGFTSYYDDLMLRRAGVIGEKAYLGCVEKAVNRVLAGPGRLLQSTAESSFDAWSKYYRQDENSPNAIVSYYVKGSLVALCLDLLIRARTRSKRSLDDVMRLMWQRWGRDFYAPRETTGRGLGEDEFPAVVREATGLDLRREIDRWAYGTGELPLATLLEPFGVTWTAPRRAPGTTIGARTVVREGQLFIASADRAGPAARAGLSAGDVIVAADGLRCNDRMLKTLLARRKAGDRLRVHAFRRDELLETDLELAAATGEVKLAAGGRNALRRAWLGD